MIDRTMLEKYGPPGFTLGQKEKDYAQHWMLSFLSRTGFDGVFKGGTCLQKAYGLPRYSEDLDFTAEKEPDYDALAAFLASAGFAGTAVKKEERNASAKAKIRLRGPLFNGKPVSETTIVLEFSKRETPIYPPEIVQIVPPYPDLMPYQAKTMDRREIAAEKVRAIMTRTSPRDLYDLYFLARSGTMPKLEDADEKLEYYGEKFSAEKFEKRVKQMEKEWDKEMKTLTASPIGYADAKKEAEKVAKTLEKQGIKTRQE